MMLTHISLFSGSVDGIGIAAKMAGFKTILLCEIDEYCQKVLRKNNHGTFIVGDVTQIYNLPKATVLSSGIPCQQHSSANKKRSGDNFEWMHTKRLIEQSNPNWVVIENVNGILTTIHEEICIDLESCGYEVETYNIPAVAVGAPHERYRVFIVANSSRKPIAQTDKAISSIRKERNPWENDLRSPWGSLPGTYWGTHKPPVCGMDDGIGDGLYKNRMKSLGNAVVPQQAYPIFKAIADIEMGCINV